MDPQACWKRFVRGLNDKDWYDAQCALEDLADWIEKGGYAPVYLLEATELRELADVLDRVVTDQEVDMDY